MASKLSTLNLEFDRVMIQFIIPGLTAVYPWAINLLNRFPLEKSYLIKNTSLLILLISIVSLVIGLFLENIGSYIEVKYLDEKNRTRKNDRGEFEFPNYDDVWMNFLMLNYDGKDPVGHRYIRNILLRMKFELSFGLALIFMAIGLINLDRQYVLISDCDYKILFFYLLPASAAAYLIFKEAPLSSRVLAKTRAKLVERYGSQNNKNRNIYVII